MRGPILSGALGSPATLDRTMDLIRSQAPVVVLSSLWLAETLATEIPVLALMEKDKHNAAAKARKRARKLDLPLHIVTAGAEVPLSPKRVGAVLLENMMDIEEVPAAADLLLTLLPCLLPQAIVLSLDATKDPKMEARVADIFLAASLIRIGQKRPRDGVLLTYGYAPPQEIISARISAIAADVTMDSMEE